MPAACPVEIVEAFNAYERCAFYGLHRSMKYWHEIPVEHQQLVPGMCMRGGEGRSCKLRGRGALTRSAGVVVVLSGGGAGAGKTQSFMAQRMAIVQNQAFIQQIIAPHKLLSSTPAPVREFALAATVVAQAVVEDRRGREGKLMAARVIGFAGGQVRGAGQGHRARL